MAPEYAKAFVDIAMVPADIDTNEDTAFVHNLDPAPITSDVKDAPRVSVSMHWMVNILTAYEGLEASDNDPDAEEARRGETFDFPDAPCLIYTETIRDFCATGPCNFPLSTCEARTVLHETLHHFEMPHDGGPHEVVIMDSQTLYTAPAVDVELNDVQIDLIRSESSP